MPAASSSRPLDALAVAATIGLCISWGFNNVAIKLAIHDIPPLTQSAARSAIAAALAFGEHIDAMPSAVAVGAFAYQTFWVVSVTFPIWFVLVVRYSAGRLSAFTFLAPLCGVAAGHLVLNEALTPAFAIAVAQVAAGLIFVNLPR